MHKKDENVGIQPQKMVLAFCDIGASKANVAVWLYLLDTVCMVLKHKKLTQKNPVFLHHTSGK